MVGRRGLLKRAGAVAVAAVGAAQLGDAEAGTSRQGQTPSAPRKRALLLLDRSMSMNAVRQATVDALNAYVDELRDKPDLQLTLLQFDWLGGKLAITETFVDVAAPEAPRLTRDDFVPRGGTPLLAAVVEAIGRLESQSGPDDKNLLAVQTDGGELNSPPEFTKDAVAALIASKQKQGNWTFAFLGADIDAWGESGAIGISVGSTLQYSNDYQGTQFAYAAAATSTNHWYASSDKSVENFFAEGFVDRLTGAISRKRRR